MPKRWAHSYSLPKFNLNMIQFVIFRCDIPRGEAERARQSRSAEQQPLRRQSLSGGCTLLRESVDLLFHAQRLFEEPQTAKPQTANLIRKTRRSHGKKKAYRLSEPLSTWSPAHRSPRLNIIPLHLKLRSPDTVVFSWKYVQNRSSPNSKPSSTLTNYTVHSANTYMLQN